MRTFPSLAIALLLATVPFAARAQAPSAYLEAGVPAVSRAWSGVDYEQAAGALKGGKVPLPARANPAGRALLARITDVENLAYHANKALPIGTRIPDFLKVLQSTNAIVMLYLDRPNEQIKAYHYELAVLQGFMMRVAESGLVLFNEFIPQIPKDESYATRMDGIRQMKAGMTTMFAGIFTSTTEEGLYTPEDRSIMYQAMADTLPVLREAFQPDYKVELRLKLTAERKKLTDSRDIRNLNTMIDLLAR